MTGTSSPGPAFVTGPCGFIGRRLIDRLLESGRAVTALCRRPDCLADLQHPGLTVLAGGLRDTPVYARFLGPETVVFHLAATRALKGNIAEMEQTNVVDLLHFARICEKARVQRFLNVSSAVVFGPSNDCRIDEAGRLNGLSFAYAESRYRALKAIRAGAAGDLDLVTICPTIVFGPDHPNHRNKITEFIRRLLQTRIAWTVGGGLATRDLVYVDDVVQGLMLAEGSACTGGEYILSGAETCQRDLNQRVAGMAGIRLRGSVDIPRWSALAAAELLDRVKRIPRRAGLTSAVKTLTADWRFSSERAARELGYTATPLDVGLKRTVEFVKRQEEAGF